MDFNGQIYNVKTNQGVSYVIAFDFATRSQLFFVFNKNNPNDDPSEGLSVFNFENQTCVGGKFGGGKSYNDKNIKKMGLFLANIETTRKPIGIAFSNTANGITPTVILGRVELPYSILPFRAYFWQSGTMVTLLPSPFRIGFGLRNNMLFVNTLASL